MRSTELALSVVVVALLGAALVYANRRRRLFLVTGTILGVLAIGWGLAARAVAVDYRDADGFLDCWPACTVLQDSVAVTLFYGPVAAVLLLVVALVLFATRPSRRRRGDDP